MPDQYLDALVQTIHVRTNLERSMSGGRVPLFAMGADGKMHYAGSTKGAGVQANLAKGGRIAKTAQVSNVQQQLHALQQQLKAGLAPPTYTTKAQAKAAKTAASKASKAAAVKSAKMVAGKNKDSLHFGVHGEDAYPKYAKTQIAKQFNNKSSAVSVKDRTDMHANFTKLQTEMKGSKGDAVKLVEDHMKANFPFAKMQYEKTPEKGLGIHLSEITKFSHELLLSNGESRFPNIISTHHAQLMANVIAPYHDSMKFLGGMNAQIAADHEIMAAHLALTTFAGKTYTVNGETRTITKADASFIANVVGDHENIYKEAGRKSFITSTDPVERAKALFFVADTLTGALVPSGTHSMKIDTEQLKTRFTDLYFRHVDLVAGKTFRPQWGVASIKDLNHTLDVLQKNGLTLDKSGSMTAQEVLRSEALSALHQAREANAARAGSSGPTFNDKQLTAITSAEKSLRSLKMTTTVSKTTSPKSTSKSTTSLSPRQKTVSDKLQAQIDALQNTLKTNTNTITSTKPGVFAKLLQLTQKFTSAKKNGQLNQKAVSAALQVEIDKLQATLNANINSPSNNGK